MKQKLNMTEAIDFLAGVHNDFVKYIREDSAYLKDDISVLMERGWSGVAADEFQSMFNKMDGAHTTMANGIEAWHSKVRSCSRSKGRDAILSACNEILSQLNGSGVNMITGILEYEDDAFKNPSTMVAGEYALYMQCSDIANEMKYINNRKLNYSYNIKIEPIRTRIENYMQGMMEFGNAYISATNIYRDYLFKLNGDLWDAVSELETVQKELKKVEPKVDVKSAVWLANHQMDPVDFGFVTMAGLADAQALVDERNSRGWIMVAIGVVGTALAVTVIVVSCGTATPLVAAIGSGTVASLSTTTIVTGTLATTAIVGGTGYGIYSLSNGIEGSQYILGDVTIAPINPGRDWAFSGNQNAWDTYGAINFAAMNVGSLGSSGAAGTAANFVKTFGTGATTSMGGRVIQDVTAGVYGGKPIDKWWSSPQNYMASGYTGGLKAVISPYATAPWAKQGLTVFDSAFKPIAQQSMEIGSGTRSYYNWNKVLEDSAIRYGTSVIVPDFAQSGPITGGLINNGMPPVFGDVVQGTLNSGTRSYVKGIIDVTKNDVPFPFTLSQISGLTP